MPLPEMPLPEVEKGWVPEVDFQHLADLLAEQGERRADDAAAAVDQDAGADKAGTPRFIATRAHWAKFARRHNLRIDPGRSAAAAMGVAALVAAVVACWWVLLDRPHGSAIVPAAPVTGALSASSAESGAVPGSSTRPSRAAGAAGATASAMPSLVVDVVGKVRLPGIYLLPSGSRVDDALRAAGGALPGTDLTTLNLARKVIDGEQIAVAAVGAPDVGAAVAGSGAATGPVDLNTASAAQLDALPGVGPVLAQHIIDWRTAHGRFDSVDQLREVSGIGQAKFADLRPLVTV
jgi:competence protein ComEA